MQSIFNMTIWQTVRLHILLFKLATILLERDSLMYSAVSNQKTFSLFRVIPSEFIVVWFVMIKLKGTTLRQNRLQLNYFQLWVALSLIL